MKVTFYPTQKQTIGEKFKIKVCGFPKRNEVNPRTKRIRIKCEGDVQVKIKYSILSGFKHSIEGTLGVNK